MALQSRLRGMLEQSRFTVRAATALDYGAVMAFSVGIYDGQGELEIFFF